MSSSSSCSSCYRHHHTCAAPPVPSLQTKLPPLNNGSLLTSAGVSPAADSDSGLIAFFPDIRLDSKAAILFRGGARFESKLPRDTFTGWILASADLVRPPPPFPPPILGCDNNILFFSLLRFFPCPQGKKKRKHSVLFGCHTQRRE